MDKKGIGIYLGVTFAVSYAIEAVIGTLPRIMPAVLLFLLLALVPAGAAWVAARLSPERPVEESRVRGLPKLITVRMALAAPLAFVFIYVVTSVLGYTRPDWRVGELMAQLPKNLGLPPAFASSMPVVFLLIGFVLSIVLGPTVYALAMLGTEYGWRGYLAPRLMPLGRWRAYLIGGLLWGLSLAPIFAVNMSGTRPAAFSRIVVMAVVLSVLLGEVWRRSRHIGLSAVCLGCFVGQAAGVWNYLFPGTYTIPPWGGPFGLVSAIVWAAIALFPEFLYGSLEPKQTAIRPEESSA